MSKLHRSAKGELVDFDLLKIKQQMASAPKAPEVKARENFIDQRQKRRLNRIKLAQPDPVEQPPVDAAPTPADQGEDVQPEVDNQPKPLTKRIKTKEPN